jgi:hypothetical protein
MVTPKKKDAETMRIVRAFTSFLEKFGEATPGQRKAFLDFIGPQSRADLLSLADALHAKIEEGDK